jgi:hypothetical protein
MIFGSPGRLGRHLGPGAADKTQGAGLELLARRFSFQDGAVRNEG